LSLAVVIPAAGPCRKMRAFGPKPLIHLDEGRSFLRRQLELLRAAHPAAEFVVVLGWDADKVARALPDWVRVVENELYEETGAARSVAMGLRATTAKTALVVWGDAYFTRKTLASLPVGGSAVLLERGEAPSEEVGATTEGGEVLSFNYGLLDTWARMMVLSGRELALFKSLAGHPDRRTFQAFEIMNAVIDEGGAFRAHFNGGEPVVVLNTARDLVAINGGKRAGTRS
jgi:hypothetical protein